MIYPRIAAILAKMKLFLSPASKARRFFSNQFLLAFTLAGVCWTGPMQAATVNFSTEQGYSSTKSVLNGQPAASPLWLASASYSVTASSGSGVVVSDRGYSSSNLAAVYQAPVSASVGGSIGLSLDFQFAGVGSANSASARYFATIDLAASSSLTAATGATDNAKLILFRNANSSNYQIYFATELNGFNASSGFSLASIGDNGTVGDLTDNLRLSLTMTKGASNTAWTVTASLLNLDTSTTVATLNLTGMGTSSTFYNAASIYGGLNSGSAYSGGSGIGTSSWSATQFTTVPEPSAVTSVLLGLGALGVLGMARKRVRPAMEAGKGHSA